jgi:hypothetical protein
MDESALYLVRVWHAGPQFRATARRVEDDATQQFAAPDELIHFLSQPIGARLRPVPPATPHSTKPAGGTPCASN